MTEISPGRPKLSHARKLLTILAADVVEYSRAVSENEEESIALLSKLRKIMDEAIQANGGKIANTAGDSVLASFESAVDAVRAAIKIQSAHDAFYQTNNSHSVLRFRIGINIGDVFVQADGDLLGHGVNVASRLETIADPGGICLSSSVVDQTEGKFDFTFSKVGEHYLKNIEKPVMVYSVGAAGKSDFRRLRKATEGIVRNPLVLSAFAILVVGSISFLFWTVLRENQMSKEDTGLRSILGSGPSSQELLDYFDLVTEGVFGNSKYYVIRAWPGEFSDMELIAEILGGYMVAIGSEDENQFVYELSKKDKGHWFFEDGNGNMGPMIGLVQKEGAEEPDKGWYWLNGEPLVYEGWSRYGPDNSLGNQSWAHLMEKNSKLRWNDQASIMPSFIAEVPEK